MLHKELTALTSGDIAQLVSDAVEESLTLEFKSQLNLGSDHDKKEAAKDVSGMANRRGGRIVYGVEEKPVGDDQRKAAAGLRPLTDRSLVERMDSVLASAITPRVSVRLKEVDAPGGFFLVVEVPASDYDLHMVTAYGECRYYHRTEKASRPMNEPDVARAYERIGRLKDGAEARIASVLREEVPDSFTARASVLLIPLTGGTGADEVDVPRTNAALMKPIGELIGAIGCSSSCHVMLSWLRLFEGGFEAVPEGSTHGNASLALRIRRDGAVHWSRADLVQAPFEPLQVLHLLRNAYRLAAFIWRESGIRGPFNTVLRLPLRTVELPVRLPEPTYPPLVLRPEHQVLSINWRSSTNLQEPFARVAQNMMDHLWQAMGRDRCPWFDAGGSLRGEIESLLSR